MPYITVHGMPVTMSQPALKKLAEKIKQTVASVPVLGIPPEEVFVFYPLDLLEDGLGTELGAKVEGLFQKPERTNAVLLELQWAICDLLREFAKVELPQCVCVETFICQPIPPQRCTIVDLACPDCRDGRGRA